jgi:hypothetical protein
VTHSCAGGGGAEDGAEVTSAAARAMSAAAALVLHDTESPVAVPSRYCAADEADQDGGFYGSAGYEDADAYAGGGWRDAGDAARCAKRKRSDDEDDEDEDAADVYGGWRCARRGCYEAHEDEPEQQARARAP